LAVLRGAANPAAARRLVRHLQGEAARALLVRAGFLVP
jgi:ABC-type molybdate transport system substrate-binding protein